MHVVAHLCSSNESFNRLVAGYFPGDAWDSSHGPESSHVWSQWLCIWSLLLHDLIVDLHVRECLECEIASNSIIIETKAAIFDEFGHLMEVEIAAHSDTGVKSAVDSFSCGIKPKDRGTE